MGTDKPRYTVSVSDEMFQQIEDFRFANRYQTRSDATAELIRLGLEALKQIGDSRGLEVLAERADRDIAQAEQQGKQA